MHNIFVLLFYEAPGEKALDFSRGMDRQKPRKKPCVYICIHKAVEVLRTTHRSDFKLQRQNTTALYISQATKQTAIYPNFDEPSFVSARLLGYSSPQTTLITSQDMVEWWETERVFLTREEANEYGENRHYRWPDGWRVYCMPAEGELAKLLKMFTIEQVD